MRIRYWSSDLFFPIACGSTDSDRTTEHGEAEKAPEGPHGGRLLTDDPLGLEVTIFENGQEPQFRTYPYWAGEPLDHGKVNLQINLSRLGGEVDRFTFRPPDDYLAGQGVVAEPHSFQVQVVAQVEGKSIHRTYQHPPGRHDPTPQPVHTGRNKH